MKVYSVYYVDYDIYEIYGIFSTYEKAQDYLDQLPTEERKYTDIEEWEVDARLRRNSHER